MEVLVCGGRNYSNKEYFFLVMDLIQKELASNHKEHISLIVSGGASGADTLAKEYALARGISFKEYPAQWHYYGKAAGHYRNASMIQNHPYLKLVVAFAGGRGTNDMIAKARAAGIHVYEVK